MYKIEFVNLLKFLADKKKILITTHDQVDLDGLGSCIVLRHLLKHLLRDQDISIFFSEFSKPARDYLEKFRLKYKDFKVNFKEKLDESKVDAVLIIDTNSLDRISLEGKQWILQEELPFIFIDHHIDSHKNYLHNREDLNIIDENFSSAAEIIYELSKAFDVNVSIEHNYLLASAILTDSKFFNNGTTETIKRMSNILKNDINFQEVLSLLRYEEELSEKIAKIKGLQRTELIREGNWLIGVTNVSSFEASVANSLIRIGFDVVVVVSKKKKESRITTRASRKACIETKLHLGKILRELSQETGLSGGGHDGAGSINGDMKLDLILNKIITKIKLVLIENKK